MTDAPHVLLTQAADRLAERAAKALPGPWPVKLIDPNDPDGCAHLQSEGRGGDLGEGCGCCTSGWLSGENARWMSAVSPAVAPHLVAWLRDSAAMYEADDRRRDVRGSAGRHYVSSVHESALGFARCVLGLPAEG